MAIMQNSPYCEIYLAFREICSPNMETHSSCESKARKYIFLMAIAILCISYQFYSFYVGFMRNLYQEKLIENKRKISIFGKQS